MKLYVWTENVQRAWTDGLACGAANDVDEARRAILDSVASHEDPSERFTFTEREQLAREIARPPDRVLDCPAGVVQPGGD